MTPRNPISPELRRGSGSMKNDVFFKNLQKRRLELGLTQEFVAKILNIHASQYSTLEGGAFPRDPRRIVALAKALKVDINYLFGFETGD
jgi:transcriptional regulator with XRE-family HTH domain